MKLGIQSNDDADKRQFDFQMAKLSSADSASKRRDSLASKVMIWGLTASMLIFCFLLVEAFFGSESQSHIAVNILMALGTGVGGYGVVTTAKKAIRHFFDGAGGNTA